MEIVIHSNSIADNNLALLYHMYWYVFLKSGNNYLSHPLVALCQHCGQWRLMTISLSDLLPPGAGVGKEAQEAAPLLDVPRIGEANKFTKMWKY